MNSAASVDGHGFSLFQLFKYGVYSLLALNVFLFFQEEWIAAGHMFSNGNTMKLSELIGNFAGTIDTFAWVLLLALFELETYILDDEKIKGLVKWMLHGTRATCYLIITYALYGYVQAYTDLSQFGPIVATDLCSMADGVNSFMTTLDRFSMIGADNCSTLAQSAVLYGHESATVLVDATTLRETEILAMVDIVNASAWLLIVFVLEVDVWLQLKNMLEGQVLFLSKIVKGVLYSVLLICSVYWGFEGTFLNFWDSFLWIAAFIFIEMNMFEWQAETHQEQSQGAAA